jgi:hypothetical protein
MKTNAQLRKHSLLVLLVLLGISAFISTANSSGSHRGIAIGQFRRLPKNPLQLRIESIDLVNIPMENAVSQIVDAINAQVREGIFLSIGIRNSKEAEYRQKRIPEAKWKLRNVTVKIQARRTNLGSVLDKLCAQAGWSYALSGPEIVFIDDTSYPLPKRRKLRR